LFVGLLAVVVASRTGEARAAAVGAQLGLDRGRIDGDAPPNSQYTSKYGVVAGIQGELGFAHALSLSLQPSYVHRLNGVLFSPSSRGGSPTELDLAFDYVSVPLVVKFAQAGARTFVSGGVTADFVTAATLSGSGPDRDVKSVYKSTAFGALLGFGVVFPAGRTHFTTELRFVQGLTNMNTGTAAAAAGALAPRLHSSGLELIVGNLFPVGSR
jgi:hypothetical protein